MRVALLTLLLLAHGSAAADIAIEGDACSGELLLDRLATLTPGVIPRATVTFERTSNAVRARITFSSGERTIDAPTCDQLEAMVAVIAAMIEPEPRVESDPPKVAPQITDPEHVIEVTAPVARNRDIGSLGIAVGMGAAVVNSGALSLVAGVRLQSTKVSFRVELQGDGYDGTSGDRRVTVSRTAIALAPCVRIGVIDACGLVRAGYLRGRGEQLAVMLTTTQPSVAVGAGMAWELAFGRRFGIRLTVEGEGAVIRNRLLVDEMPVWTTPSVELRAGFALFAILR